MLPNWGLRESHATLRRETREWLLEPTDLGMACGRAGVGGGRKRTGRLVIAAVWAWRMGALAVAAKAETVAVLG